MKNKKKTSESTLRENETHDNAGGRQCPTKYVRLR